MTQPLDFLRGTMTEELWKIIADQQKRIEALEQLVAAGTARLGACERQIARLTKSNRLERPTPQSAADFADSPAMLREFEEWKRDEKELSP